MELIIVMNNKYSTDADIKRLIAYIAGKGTNDGKQEVIVKRGCGISNQYKEAAKQMIKIQELFGKNNRRRCYHMIISFPQEMADRNVVILAADAVACMIFDEMYHQVFYGIHTSTDNLHIHFAINAVNYKSGKKWHKSKYEFEEFKKSILEMVGIVN